MSDPKLHDRGMTDTESVALAAKGYKPVLEQQYSSILAIGSDPN